MQQLLERRLRRRLPRREVLAFGGDGDAFGLSLVPDTPRAVGQLVDGRIDDPIGREIEGERTREGAKWSETYQSEFLKTVIPILRADDAIAGFVIWQFYDAGESRSDGLAQIEKQQGDRRGVSPAENGLRDGPSDRAPSDRATGTERQ